MRKTLAIAIGAALGVALALVGTAALAARNSSGTFSLNPTSPFVTGTPISSSTMNTRFSDVATEITDSLSRSNKGAMLAPIRLYSGGNATTPELTWADETTTGLYLVGANDVGLSIGGTKRWEHNAVGQIETGWLQVAGSTTVGGTFTSGAITAPSVTSSGAALALAAPSTFDVELSASTTLGFVVDADGFNDNKSRRLVNVTDPTSAQDAATKAYVDAFVPDVVTTALAAGANWTMNSTRVSKAGRAVTVNLALVSAGVGASWGSVATVPAAYRPGASLYSFGTCLLGATVALCRGTIATTGVISVDLYDNATSLVAITGPSNNDTLRLHFTYVAEN